MITATFQVFCWGEKKLRTHWNESFVSAPTYFENIHGFEQQQSAAAAASTKQASLSLDPSVVSSGLKSAAAVTTSTVFPQRQSKFAFLSSGKSYPTVTFTRGFKTKRANAGTLPFTR